MLMLNGSSYTDKKNNNNNIKKLRKKLRTKVQKLCDMYLDSMSQLQKHQKNNNIAISFSKDNNKMINSTVTPFKHSVLQH